LSPVLGQHAVKVADFVTEFNKVTAGYTPGVVVGVRLTKLAANKFTFVVAPPPGVHLVRSGVAAGRVGRTHLWDVLRVGRTTPAAASALLGTVRSAGWTVD
jgi:ribosomal protein L11